MCDIYIPTIGCICYDCSEGFSKRYPTFNSEEDLRYQLEEYLNNESEPIDNGEINTMS